MGCLSLLWMYTSLITFFALFLCTNTSLIFLTATNSPVLLSLARQTTLKEPFPMDRRSSYLSPTCDQPTEIGNTMSAGGIGFFSFAGDGSRGRRGMIKTYFPHITLYDEGTVSLVRELLDAASVGGHRRGSHAAAHRLGFPPPLDLQPRPADSDDTSTSTLSRTAARQLPQKVSERKIFSTNRNFDLEMSTKTDRPQELPGEEGSRHRLGEDGDGTVSAEREDGEQGHPPCHQVCPRGSVRVPIGKAGRTHRDRGRLHPFFSQGREQALTAARGGPRTGKT